VRLTAINLNTGTRAWMVPLGDGPRQRVISLGIPDPGPLGGGTYSGPLVTKTLLFLALRSEAPDLVLGAAAAAAQAAGDQPRPAGTPPPVLLAFDKTKGTTVHSVELDVAPTGTPMTYMSNGRQYLVLAYGTGSSSGLIAFALERR
jgi:quinoprotein glucose dehydrogenase